MEKPKISSALNYYWFTKLKGEEFVKDLANQTCIARSSVIYASIPATGKINFALWLIDKIKRKERVAIVTTNGTYLH
jgi:dTDP-4-dehydrorhamnose reductase